MARQSVKLIWRHQGALVTDREQRELLGDAGRPGILRARLHTRREVARDAGEARQERHVVLLRENRRKAVKEGPRVLVCELTLRDARGLVLERLNPVHRGLGDKSIVRCVPLPLELLVDVAHCNPPSVPARTR